MDSAIPVGSLSSEALTHQLAQMLGLDRSRVRQLIAEYNQENAQAQLCPVRPKPSLPDGARSGAAQRSHYLIIGDVVRLLHWLLRKTLALKAGA